jgi:UDP-glucose 4-epimerase
MRAQPRCRRWSGMKLLGYTRTTDRSTKESHSMSHILVTGGAGYIGSHTCVELLEADYQVTVVDNLSNSKPQALERVQELAGKSLAFHRVDLLDRQALEAVFQRAEYQAVIHFAGLKAPGESVQQPLRYYHNNIIGTLTLCECMAKYGVKRMVFSSSATVYSPAAEMPVNEQAPCGPINPYGRTKWMIEMILQDLHTADPQWDAILLRYFNPVGAHPSGRIGEDPQGIPNNLLPYICQVAVGKHRALRVWGDDYPTPDGTGVRDYIHVVDLARGHLNALEKLKERPGVKIYNLGTNQGYSVMEIVAAFERASGVKISYEIHARRPGDLPTSYANADKARRELSWRSEKSLDEICADAWRWQSDNPNGYE